MVLSFDLQEVPDGLEYFSDFRVKQLKAPTKLEIIKFKQNTASKQRRAEKGPVKSLQPLKIKPAVVELFSSGAGKRLALLHIHF